MGSVNFVHNKGARLWAIANKRNRKMGRIRVQDGLFYTLIWLVSQGEKADIGKC